MADSHVCSGLCLSSINAINMTLNERTYLMDFILKFLPEEPNLWELTEVITDLQRKKLLALCFNKKAEDLKSMVEDIKNFQLQPERN
jgi:hypothetical protein